MVGCQKVAARLVCLLLIVFMLGASHELCAKKKPPAHPVNLNTASATELQQVPGIGPATADKILQARNSYGSFKSVDDLQAIKGIGPKRLEKMRKYLTVSKPQQNNKPSAPAPQPAKNQATKSPQTSKVQPAPPASDEEEQ